VLACVFVVVPLVGLPGASMLAGATNVALALGRATRSRACATRARERRALDGRFGGALAAVRRRRASPARVVRLRDRVDPAMLALVLDRPRTRSS
jgi:hypothetical protein